MSSKVRINTYFKYNKVGELFQEMMGKLMHDLPANPLEYLVQFLQKKALEKTKAKDASKPGNRSSKSALSTHSSSSSAKMWSDAAANEVDELVKNAADGSVDAKSEQSRHYQKPWLTNSKRPPGKQSEKQLSKTLPPKFSSLLKNDGDDVTSKSLDAGLITEASKTIGETTTSELDSNSQKPKPKMYGKSNAHNNSRKKDDDELKCIADDVNKENVSFAKKLPKQDSKMRRHQLLRKQLNEKETRRAVNNDTDDDDFEDDGRELCEDALVLESEGVKNPPKTGVHVSRSNRKQKEEIELVLNMSKFFDNLGGSLSVNQLAGSNIAQNQFDGDDYFESVSQVTGPRPMVWEVAESELESSQAPSRRVSRTANANMFDISSSLSKDKREKKNAANFNKSSRVSTTSKVSVSKVLHEKPTGSRPSSQIAMQLPIQVTPSPSKSPSKSKSNFSRPSSQIAATLSSPVPVAKSSSRPSSRVSVRASSIIADASNRGNNATSDQLEVRSSSGGKANDPASSRPSSRVSVRASSQIADASNKGNNASSDRLEVRSSSGGKAKDLPSSRPSSRVSVNQVAAVSKPSSMVADASKTGNAKLTSDAEIRSSSGEKAKDLTSSRPSSRVSGVGISAAAGSKPPSDVADASKKGTYKPSDNLKIWSSGDQVKDRPSSRASDSPGKVSRPSSVIADTSASKKASPSDDAEGRSSVVGKTKDSTSSRPASRLSNEPPPSDMS